MLTDKEAEEMTRKKCQNVFQAIMIGLDLLSRSEVKIIVDHLIKKDESGLYYYKDQDGYYIGPFFTKDEAFDALMEYADKVLKEAGLVYD